MRRPFVNFVMLATIAFTSFPVLAAIAPAETPPATDASTDLLDAPPAVRNAAAPAAPARRLQAKQQNALIGNPLWAIPLKQLSVTRDRPIFSPSRRPPPVAAPVAAEPPKPAIVVHQPERPQLSLVGTIVSKDAAIGIFIDNTTRKAILLKLGQNHSGWTLTSVSGNAAILARFEQSVVIAMRAHDNPHEQFSRAGQPPQPQYSGAATATTPKKSAPSTATSGGQQLFGRLPFATTPVSEGANPFGATPLLERSNR